METTRKNLQKIEDAMTHTTNPELRMRLVSAWQEQKKTLSRLDPAPTWNYQKKRLAGKNRRSAQQQKTAQRSLWS